MSMHDDQHPVHAVSPEDLQALFDDRLSASEAARVRTAAAKDPEASDELAAWARQQEALRTLHRSMAQAPAPSAVLAAALRAQSSFERVHRIRRLGGVAAAILIAFAAGWLSNGQWQGTRPAAQLALQFVHQAAVAHVIYQPEVRHPVEVEAAQQEHLVQWLSKRLGRPLKVPQLQAQGYELLGGRLLPGGDGVRAQFMFQNTQGHRITLYIGAVDPKIGAQQQETAFRFSKEGPVPGFYWVDQGFGYAVTGQLAREALMEIATAIYRQL